MSVCLNDVLNLSCFPKTLGSESQPSDADEGSLAGIISIYIAAVVVGGAFLYAIAKWFNVYKLRYFLRINLLAFTSANLISILSKFRNIHPEDFVYYLSILWYASGLGALTMLPVRYYWKFPINIKKRLKKRKTKVLHVKIDEIPPVYPNSWIPVLDADKLHKRDIEGVHALGKKFCVYRGESGDSTVMNAYCPHLGADMTEGGKVRGECVECPFHGWKINGFDGTCTPSQPKYSNDTQIQSIEYCQEEQSKNKEDNKEQANSTDREIEVPKKLKKKILEKFGCNNYKMKPWESVEVNRWIYAWHHTDEDAEMWEMPRIEEICNGEWIYRGRTEHEVNCHIQEIPENGADINHLHQLHSTNVFMGNNWMDTTSWLNILNHHWEPRWRRDPDHRHIARITLKQTTTLFGWHLPFKMGELDLEIEQIGPATVHLHIKSWFGKGVLLQHIIPEGPLFMRVIHQLYTEPSFPAFPAELLLRAEAIMFERNIASLEGKEYIVKSQHSMDRCSECPIHERRKWYLDTFTSQNSPTLRHAKEQTLDF